jgi:hypothetical protein
MCINVKPSLAFRVGVADTSGRRVASDPQVACRPLLSVAMAGVLSVATLDQFAVKRRLLFKPI